jgi:hypothetical protein
VSFRPIFISVTTENYQQFRFEIPIGKSVLTRSLNENGEQLLTGRLSLRVASAISHRGIAPSEIFSGRLTF